VALAGVGSGLAYLTRYNGLFLLAACVFGIVVTDLFARRLEGRLRLAGLYVAAFLLTSSPWLYLNYRHNGSPFYNANYLNMAAEFYPELVEGRTNQDATRALDRVFHSFADVVRHDPARFLTHYPANLWASARDSVTTTLVNPWVGGFALLGLVLALAGRSSKPTQFVLASAALYFLLMGLNHWEARYYFFVLVVYALLASFAAFRLLEVAREHRLLRHRAGRLLPVAALLLMVGTSLADSRRNVMRFLESHPMELLGARDYIRSTGATGLRILSRKPHLAF
jgi:hypothetical protein